MLKHVGWSIVLLLPLAVFAAGCSREEGPRPEIGAPPARSALKNLKSPFPPPPPPGR